MIERYLSRKEVVTLDDSKIIELFFHRDQFAISETRDKYGKLLMSISRNILGSELDAQECLYDTLLRVWNTIPPKNPPSLMAYCAKIMRNVSLNKLKYQSADKRGSGNYVTALDELDDMLPSNENVEAQFDANALTGHINSFLSTLPQESRMMFIKRYWYFRSVAEIAGELGITRTKVTTTLHRTRQKLKEYLEKEGYEI